MAGLGKKTNMQYKKEIIGKWCGIKGLQWEQGDAVQIKNGKLIGLVGMIVGLKTIKGKQWVKIRLSNLIFRVLANKIIVLN